MLITPCDGPASLVGLLHRYVGHEVVGGAAVPVVFARLEEGADARADHLDGAAVALAELDALGNADNLTEGAGVPGAARQLRPVRARVTEAVTGRNRIVPKVAHHAKIRVSVRIKDR